MSINRLSTEEEYLAAQKFLEIINCTHVGTLTMNKNKHVFTPDQYKEFSCLMRDKVMSSSSMSIVISNGPPDKFKEKCGQSVKNNIAPILITGLVVTSLLVAVGIFMRRRQPKTI